MKKRRKRREKKWKWKRKEKKERTKNPSRKFFLMWELCLKQKVIFVQKDEKALNQVAFKIRLLDKTPKPYELKSSQSVTLNVFFIIIKISTEKLES